ncbi:MAG: hypothetical protein WBG08_01775 [Litorimonas sp.]
MKTSAYVLACGALLSSGCATVDLQSMAGSTGEAALEAPVESNVVERAVDRLKAAFASRGFGAKTSQKKMHAAADMLLNGLSARSVAAEEDAYDAAALPLSVLMSDIEMAQSHVDQTRRAAEIYFEVAPQSRDLSGELEHLQAALLASEKATRLFAGALPEDSAGSLLPLRGSVDGLRQITDAFGDRVRASKAATAPAAT